MAKTMRFTVVTCVTEGDTRPIIGVCRGLLNAGHDVQFFGDRSTLSIAESHGIPARPLHGDIKAVLDSGRAFENPSQSEGKVIHLAKFLAQIANENALQWMKEVGDDARSSQAILFSGIASYVGLAIAEGLRLPGVGLGLLPISPTMAFPSPLLPIRKFPKIFNRISYKAVNTLFWYLFRRKINVARKEIYGQESRKKMWRDYPILYGISRHLIPEPTDWPEIWKLCGAWTTEHANWQPPASLVDFLASGPPPIYVGFGSMAGFDRQKMLATVIEAVDGRRALFFPGWSGIEPNLLPRNFFVIGATPHSWLFPHTSMVIHHGGAGTSHTASRAGVPSIVIPFGGDQFFWAQRLATLGVAPPFVSHSKITASALSRMIAFAEKSETIQRARRLGAAMAQEDGISYAVQQIEKYTASPPSF